MRQIFLNKGSIALKEVCEPILNDHSILISVYHSLIIPEIEKPLVTPHQAESIFKDIPGKIKQFLNSYPNIVTEYEINSIKSEEVIILLNNDNRKT